MATKVIIIGGGDTEKEKTTPRRSEIFDSGSRNSPSLPGLRTQSFLCEKFISFWIEYYSFPVHLHLHFYFSFNSYSIIEVVIPFPVEFFRHKRTPHPPNLWIIIQLLNNWLIYYCLNLEYEEILLTIFKSECFRKWQPIFGTGPFARGTREQTGLRGSF